MNQVNKIQKILRYSHKLNLLFVEDNLEAREATLLVLKDFFTNITVAIDGEDGLFKFKTNAIDIIITDLNMPRLDGMEMIERIRKIDEDIPILVLSAHDESEYFIQGIIHNVDGYLLKPMDIKQFSQSLHKSITNIKLKKETQNYQDSLEEKIELQDKLLMQQSKMAIMGNMIDMIAHQWKQPLNAIIMQKELVEMDLKEGIIDKKSIKEALDITQNQVEHLVVTMQEFRNFFKPHLQETSFKIKKMFESIAILLKDELIQYSINLNIICNKEISLKANENDIKHLFINLINNAKDEMLSINLEEKKREITIECTKKDNAIIFLVHDNGRGISLESKNKIFEAYFTTKDDSKGSGTGLYMSKQIVDKYSGTISVDNDKGAIFKVKFPSL